MTEMNEEIEVNEVEAPVAEEVIMEEWKSYPEFSNYLFSNTERVMKGDREIKIQINRYDRKMATIFDDTGKSRGVNVSYICEILFPKKAFKQYPNYSNYLIYEDGTILNKVSKIVLRVFEPKIIKRKRVRLINDEGEKLELDLAHIVAELFLENPQGHKFIRHKDGNILNNHYLNLEFVHSLLEKPYEEIEGEEWRDIKDMEDYQVSNKGRVKNKHNNFLMNPRIENGYIMCSIQQNKYSVHRLVAGAFIPNPENKPSVDHIDRDPTNNNLENLRWATTKEQAQNKIHSNGNHFKKINMIDIKSKEIIKQFNNIHEAIDYVETITSEYKRKTIENHIRSVCNDTKENAFNFKWKYSNENELCELEDEIWKNVKEIEPNADDYLISNKGRIKNKNGEISEGRIQNGYNVGYIGKDVTRKLVHILVAKLFIPNPQNKPCVNHKDGNKTNNCITNLEWNTYSENTQHAFDTNLNSHGIKIKVTNIITKESKLYPTKVRACEDIKVEIKTFNRYLKSGKSFQNMLFETI